MPDLSPLDTFHLEQFKALRAEIDEGIKLIRQIETYLIIGCSAVWAFMAVHRELGAAPTKVGWSLPVVLVLIALVIHWSTRKSIIALGRYIQRVELHFTVQAPAGKVPEYVVGHSSASLLEGWEASKELGGSRAKFSRFNWTFWPLMFVVTGAIAFMMGWPAGAERAWDFLLDRLRFLTPCL